MKKIISFEKKLTFDTNVSEITSISLENTLHSDNSSVIGDLIINGSYKITDASIKTDDFEFTIPVNIDMADRYVIDDIAIDIDDFYYEIINNNILEVNIDISLDNLVEKSVIEPVHDFDYEEENLKMESLKLDKSLDVLEEDIVEEDRCIDQEIENVEEDKQIVQGQINETTSIFSNFNDNEEYTTYHVYIVREGDTLDSIMAKYEISKDDLIEYNDLSELKLGDKLIIPQVNV